VAGEGRKSADELLASILAAGAKHCDAALRVGISERTIQRRLLDPEFAAMVQKFRTQMVDEALGKLASKLTEATDAIAGLISSENEAVRLRAAERLIELTLRVGEHIDIRQRVEELEQLLKERRP
jgi:hypothetical protein